MEHDLKNGWTVSKATGKGEKWFNVYKDGEFKFVSVRLKTVKGDIKDFLAAKA